MSVEFSLTKHIQGLITQIPISSKSDKCKSLSLVIEPNNFKKYYQLFGKLLFLKEMEKQDKICIKRVSASVFSCVYAILYLLDKLELFNELYTHCTNNVKINQNQYIDEPLKYSLVIEFIEKYLPDDAYSKLTNKLYISYYDVRWKKKITKHTFTSNEHLIDIVRKSMFIPFFFDGNPLFKKRYMACENSYSFEKCKHPIINIQSYGISNLFTNNHEFGQSKKQGLKQLRIGIIDTYSFFATESSTETISFVNTYLSKDIWHVELKKILEQVTLFIISITVQLAIDLKRRIREKIGIYKTICSPMVERRNGNVKKHVKSRKKDKYHFRMGMGMNVCGLPMTMCGVCA